MSHHTEIPPELDTLAVPFELSLPDEAALREIFKEEVQAWQRATLPRQVAGDRDAYEMLLRNLRGLTEPDVRRLIREAIEDDGVIDASDLPRLIIAEAPDLQPRQHLSFEFDTARFADVAGLKSLKQWLEPAPRAFSRRRRRRHARRAEGHHAARRAGLRQEPGRQGRRRRLGRAADAARLRRALRQVPRRDRAPPARGAAQGGRVDGAVRAVDRRDREGPRQRQPTTPTTASRAASSARC